MAFYFRESTNYFIPQILDGIYTLHKNLKPQKDFDQTTEIRPTRSSTHSHSTHTLIHSLTHTPTHSLTSPCRYIFDDLSTQQAEDLLRQHGEHGVYLVTRFNDPRSYQLVIRFKYDPRLVFTHQ